MYSAIVWLSEQMVYDLLMCFKSSSITDLRYYSKVWFMKLHLIYRGGENIWIFEDYISIYWLILDFCKKVTNFHKRYTK